MKRQILKIIFSISILVLSISASAQGPQLSYFHNSFTQLQWASCYINFEKGSKQKIGFFPVINEKTNAPMGIENYSKDVNIDKGLVFLKVNIADTFSFDKFEKEDIHLENKIVMLCDYSSNKQDSSIFSPLLEEKINYAINKNAAALIIIALENSFPLYTVNLNKEIPVISISNQTAISIFKSAGINYSKIKNNDKIPVLTELPINIKLNIDGNFSCIETENFNFKYLPHQFTKAKITQQESINEQSVDFIIDLFKELGLEWNKENIYYFSNYTSKIFYTGYWGIGFSCHTGVYNVYSNNDKSYSLSVHENTHSLLRKNSLFFNSFFNEGIARYAEAMATNKDLNNKKVIEFLKNNKLFSLEKMLDFDIGHDQEETIIGYPASGSFVEFLIKKYGVKIILRLNKNALRPISKKELINLEEEWLNWLREEI